MKRCIAWCGEQIQFRVEEQPDGTWLGYILRRPIEMNIGGHRRTAYWKDEFSSLSESLVKQAAVETARSLFPELLADIETLQWSDASGISNEAWQSSFQSFLPHTPEYTSAAGH